MRDSKCSVCWRLGVGGLVLILGLAMIPQVTQAASPDTISGLKVWFDADSIGQGNSTPVTAWGNDAAGSGLDEATVDVGSPTYITGVINGHAVVRFATGDTMDWEKSDNNDADWGDAGLTAGVTHFAVVNPTTADNSYLLDNGSALAYVVRTTKANVSRYVANSIGEIGAVINEPIIHASTLTDIADGVKPSCWATINGQLSVSNTAAVNSSNMGSVSKTSFGHSGSGGNWAGDIAEVIMYDRVLSESEIETVGLYLASKYNISRAWASDGEPDTISGLIAWFKADSIGQADGTDVTAWGNDAAFSSLDEATGPGSEATYQTGELNGHAVVRFASGDGLDWEKSDNSSAGWGDAGVTEGVTQFAVIHPATPEHSYLGNGYLRFVGRTTKVNVSRAPNNSIGAIAAALNEPIIHAATLTDVTEAATPTCWSSINGQLSVSNTGPGANNAWSGVALAHIGNYNDGAEREWGGDIAEIIVYNRVLDESEIEAVGRYLGTKYGIRAWPSDGGPDTISGLKVWFKADSIGQGDGTDLTAWSNDAPFSSLDEATGPGGEATYQTGEINGHAVVRFAVGDGLGWEKSDNSDATWGDAGLTAGVTHLAVVYPSEPDHSYLGHGNFRYVARTTKSNVSRTPNNSIGWVDEAISEPIVHATTLSDISDGVVPTCWATHNGFTSANNTGPGTSSGLGTARVYLGNYDGGRQWAGDIAEVVIYSRVLDELEIKTVGFYLGDKYGIKTAWGPKGTIINIK